MGRTKKPVVPIPAKAITTNLFIGDTLPFEHYKVAERDMLGPSIEYYVGVIESGGTVLLAPGFAGKSYAVAILSRFGLTFEDAYRRVQRAEEIIPETKAVLPKAH